MAACNISTAERKPFGYKWEKIVLSVLQKWYRGGEKDLIKNGVARFTEMVQREEKELVKNGVGSLTEMVQRERKRD